MLRGSIKKVVVRGRGRGRGMRLYFAAPSHSLNSKVEVGGGGGGQNRRGKNLPCKGENNPSDREDVDAARWKKKKKGGRMR